MSAPSSSELEPILKGMKKGQTLEQFKAEWSPLPPGFIEKCAEMVERVIRFLKQHTPISVAKVIKGGSIGKNTLVYTQSDVDLFIFLNNLNSVADMKTKTRGILTTIKEKLDSASWHSGFIEFLDSNSSHSLKFTLHCGDLEQAHTIDILPAYDILQYKNVEEIYQEMMNLSEEDREFYSVCLGPKQIAFIKEAPSKVQDLMKILKYWTKTDVNADMKSATSYLMEVLVMNRWHDAKKPYDFIITDWFEEIVSQLADLPSLFVVWRNRYIANHYRALPSPPVVLDPVNPFRNLIPPQEYRAKIMARARTVLRRMKKLREYKQSGPPPVLQDMRRGQSLQQFIVETIQPDSDFRRNCDEVVERVTYFLQNHTDFSVSKVVKGGSLGKSTNILGKSDVDLVVFISTLGSVKDLENKMEFLLSTLKNDLAREWPDYAGFLKLERETRYGLHYTLSCSENGHKHDVDILPACNVLKEVGSLEQVHSEMSRQTPDEREYYNVCFAPKQVEFVKQVPVKVKNLIRLVKYWAKTELNTERKVVTSYFLECLIMYRWIELGRLEDFNTNDWFKEIMVQLSNLASIRILWPRHYHVALFYNVEDFFPRNPILLDPFNPFRNLVPKEKHHGLVMERARVVVQKIEDLHRYRNGKYLESK